MAEDRHSLLVRQLRKHLPPEEAERPEIRDFLEAVDAAYRQSDDDRLMLERSLELSSFELLRTEIAKPKLLCTNDTTTRLSL